MSKIKLCKACGKEVAKSSKKCPYCGTKLKGSKLKFLFGGVFVFIIIFFIIIISLGGNASSDPKQESSVKNNSQSQSQSVASNNPATATQTAKKTIELLSYIGKSEADVKKDFGNPNKIDNTESGELYDYTSFYFGLGDKKVNAIGVKNSNSDVTVNGIKIGMLPKDVKSKLGNPAKELNDNGYVLEYRLNNNTISIQYHSSDFSSKVDLITISDLTYGKEKPMDVTKEQVNQLMNGTWVLEKYIHEKNLSLFKHIFSNGIIDTNLSEHLQKKYEVTSPTTITMRGETLNGFGSTEKLEAEFHIEFFDNGDRMVIYHLDQAGDRDSEDVYIRYN